MRVCGDETFKQPVCGRDIMGVAHKWECACAVCNPKVNNPGLDPQLKAACDAILDREYLQTSTFAAAISRFALQRQVWVCNAMMTDVRRKHPALMQEIESYDAAGNSAYCASPFELLGQTKYTIQSLYYRCPNRLCDWFVERSGRIFVLHHKRGVYLEFNSLTMHQRFWNVLICND